MWTVVTYSEAELQCRPLTAGAWQMTRGQLLFLHALDASCVMQANPHKRVRQLYGARMMTSYRGVPLGELSPHVYAIAEQVGQLW